MSKLKVFIVSAALVLVTIGAFAGKSMFAESLDLYVDVSGTKVEITNGAQSFIGLTTTSGGLGVQTEIKNRDGIMRQLFHFNGSSYVPVYSTGTW